MELIGDPFDHFDDSDFAVTTDEDYSDGDTN